MSAVGRTNIEGALNNFEVNTVLDVRPHADGVYTGRAETDIIHQTKSYMGGRNGVAATWCNGRVNDRKCDQHYVRFRDNIHVTRNVACHETGHAVGLGHGETSEPDKFPSPMNNAASLRCMRYPSPSPYLGAFNSSQINGAY